ncbi:hypothetical protein HRG84_24185 [Flavisolibacter sp. BT320]|nr:hypothetical protein [Flavisolibacter longurius]
MNIYFRFFICLFVLTLASCERNRLTVYSCNGVNVTRIDKDAETFFYYGDFRNDSKLPDEYIKASYSGFDGVMSSYVIFNNDKTVTFIDLGDGIEKRGQTQVLNIFEHKANIDFINWQKTFMSKFDSIIRVFDALNIEQEVNTKNNSKVQAIYY